jgi:hypothetical protein
MTIPGQYGHRAYRQHVSRANGNTIPGVCSLFRVAASAALTILVAIPVIAASPAQAATKAATKAATGGKGGTTMAIDSISPRIATATSTIVVSGSVTNGTGSPLTGMSVQLYSTSAQFSIREWMDEFAAGTYNPSMVADGNAFEFTGTIQPGGTASWKVEFTSADAGLADFGVYGLAADLTGPVGTIAATSRTLLPFWPGGSGVGDKLKVAWIWPLIDQPYTQACGSLTSDDLESSLGSGGRLDNLLTAGTSDPSAQLTWAVDPALLGDAQTLSKRHQVATPDCADQTEEPASTAARSWLTGVQSATASQPVIVTPYANVDVAALVHNGLDGDLVSAYKIGQNLGVQELSKAFVEKIALPAGGLADQSVLSALAAPPLRYSSVVLDSDEMPLTNGEFGDNAVSSWPSSEGTMSVLLADDTVTDLLKGAGTTSAGGQFAIEQQFLAETAMIVAEAPNDPRSLVVSPPETWDPSEALAADLLSETTSAPWLQPVSLESLTGPHGGGGASHESRKPLPGDKVSSKELSRTYLSAVSKLDAQFSVYSSMLADPKNPYQTHLGEAIAAAESSAWRDGGASAATGAALVSGLNQYLYDADRKVKIIGTGPVSMAGASGLLPVTIQNDLSKQTVRVRLVATVATARGYANTMTVAQQKLVTIPPGQVKLVKLSVRSARQGSTTINLSLADSNGTILPWTANTQLTVNSTRYGQAILILIAAAIGLLLLSSAFRSGRRRLAASAEGSDEGPGSGNVMTSEKDPTEAPDDLADARRWADDT